MAMCLCGSSKAKANLTTENLAKQPVRLNGTEGGRKRSKKGDKMVASSTTASYPSEIRRSSAKVQIRSAFRLAIHHLFTHPPTPRLCRLGRGSFSAIHARERQERRLIRPRARRGWWGVVLWYGTLHISIPLKSNLKWVCLTLTI